MAGVERRVNEGQTYCVTPSVDCTVSTLGGTELVNVAAGSQDYFVAPAGTVVVSDAGARLTASRSPAWLASRSPAWLASRNPAWLAELRAGLEELGLVYKLAWMPAGEKLVVHTDRADDTQLEQVAALLERVLPQNIELVQVNHHIEVSWRDINRFVGCVTDADIAARCPEGDAGNLLTSDGWWVYRMPDYFDYPSSFYDKNQIFRKNVTHIVTDGKLVQNYGGYWARNYTMFGWCPKLIFVELLNGPADDMIRWFCGCSKLSHVRIDFSRITGSIEHIFDSCVLDRDSVLHVLEGLPLKPKQKVTTLGIHIDHQNDEEVLAAIANAEAKGWTLTVQWNGTPTSTASTLSFGQLIYAKVSEMERPDGTTEKVLDWGHYVTDPTGYETFRSLESAYEYFGLEMPAEEELSS